jgi:integrase/recombinase XerD
MRTLSSNTKSPKLQKSVSNNSDSDKSLQEVIEATTKLWRKYHLNYDQVRYVSKEARKSLNIQRVKARKNVIERLSQDEEKRLIAQAYRDKSEHGLLIKTLFQTGARVSEFVSIKVADVYFDELMILIEKGKGNKSRYVPILPELAQELRTHLKDRKVGYLFESNRNLSFSARRIQQIVKATAEKAEISKKVHPHLLRHTVATFLLEKGMSLEQIQKFLGHSKLETTQIYAESTTEMIKDNFQKAFGK